jgi:hypothetical protein
MDQKVLSFNSIKHHLLFARQMIAGLTENETNKDLKAILNEIKKIGNNILDLYIGKLAINEIFNEIVFQLNSLQIEEKNDFVKWLSPSGYKTLELSDNSMWILRYRIKDDSFVHIHPARYGKHVIRITGSAWKTALTIAILKNKIPGKLIDSIDKINFVRTHFLKLSPVKKIVAGSNLDNTLKLLRIL